ncbi:MAG: hypothetical protein JWN95_1101 [Frankiales bacterium]|nr:hypothetical protein [Frankiales bacterium]
MTEYEGTPSTPGFSDPTYSSTLTSDLPTSATPTGDGPANSVGTSSNRADDASKAELAKSQAASVSHRAADAGQQVAATAKDQVHNVVGEAGSQAKDLLQQTRGELTEQAKAQQQRLAGGLRALGDELHSMADGSEQSGVATDLARQAATKSHDAAGWLDSREPGNLVDELKRFARQRPGAFLALAAGAGLLAGRLTRGVKDASSDEPSADPYPPETVIGDVPPPLTSGVSAATDNIQTTDYASGGRS